MTAVDHLIAALVELEQQSIEIEHRQSFIRSAIEAFGIDADDALLVAMREEGEPPAYEPSGWAGTPETAQQIDPEQYGRLPSGRWDWDLVAIKIRMADHMDEQRARHLADTFGVDAVRICMTDDIGQRRTKYLADTFGVSALTAQWMVKRCREMSLIDTERTPVNHQAARDAAAAAL